MNMTSHDRVFTGVMAISSGVTCLSSFSMESIVRGHHIYKDRPYINEKTYMASEVTQLSRPFHHFCSEEVRHCGECAMTDLSHLQLLHLSLKAQLVNILLNHRFIITDRYFCFFNTIFSGHKSL